MNAKMKSLLGVILGVWLMGCASATPAHSKPTGSIPPGQQAANLGQKLPISAQAIIAGQTIRLEVARTPQQQATGLMYRTSLAEDRGMLFTFNPPQPVTFWMKNTLIPLDMIFVQNGVVKEIAANVPPCTTKSCPTYGPKTLVSQVIELQAGRAARIGLKVGDQIVVRFLDKTNR